MSKHLANIPLTNVLPYLVVNFLKKWSKIFIHILFGEKKTQNPQNSFREKRGHPTPHQQAASFTRRGSSQPPSSSSSPLFSCKVVASSARTTTATTRAKTTKPHLARPRLRGRGLQVVYCARRHMKSHGAG